MIELDERSDFGSTIAALLPRQTRRARIMAAAFTFGIEEEYFLVAARIKDLGRS